MSTSSNGQPMKTAGEIAHLAIQKLEEDAAEKMLRAGSMLQQLREANTSLMERITDLEGDVADRDRRLGEASERIKELIAAFPPPAEPEPDVEWIDAPAGE